MAARVKYYGKTVNDYDKFTDKIICARTVKGWNVTEAAKKIGISGVQLKNIENRNSTPRIETLVQIADAYGLNRVELAESLDLEKRSSIKKTS